MGQAIDWEARLGLMRRNSLQTAITRSKAPFYLGQRQSVKICVLSRLKPLQRALDPRMCALDPFSGLEGVYGRDPRVGSWPRQPGLKDGTPLWGPGVRGYGSNHCAIDKRVKSLRNV